MALTLEDAARAALEANTEGGYVTAGRHQYRAVWVRDTCYAARGLVRAGKADVLRKLILAYVAHLRRDGVGPKGFDSYPFEWRQVEPCIRRPLGLQRKKRPFDPEKLRPVYKDTVSGREAFDSNLLVIIAAHELPTNPLGKETAETLLKYYEPYVRDGLLEQPPFTDWKDSLRRKGATSSMNLLYYRARVLCARSFAVAFDAERFRARFLEAFFRGGLVHDKPKGPWVSLDANLFAIRWGVVGGSVYGALKEHPVWRATTWPRDRQCALPIRLAGMREYHNGTRWSWLMALQATTALEQGDAGEGLSIHRELQERAERDGHIAECFSREGKRWTTYAYQTEGPFTWGAAYVMELEAARETQTKKEKDGP